MTRSSARKKFQDASMPFKTECSGERSTVQTFQQGNVATAGTQGSFKDEIEYNSEMEHLENKNSLDMKMELSSFSADSPTQFEGSSTTDDKNFVKEEENSAENSADERTEQTYEGTRKSPYIGINVSNRLKSLKIISEGLIDSNWSTDYLREFIRREFSLGFSRGIEFFRYYSKIFRCQLCNGLTDLKYKHVTLQHMCEYSYQCPACPFQSRLSSHPHLRVSHPELGPSAKWISRHKEVKPTLDRLRTKCFGPLTTNDYRGCRNFVQRQWKALLECNVCEEIIPSNRTLFHVANRHQDRNLIYCPFCSYGSRADRYTVVGHINKAHGLPRYSSIQYLEDYQDRLKPTEEICFGVKNSELIAGIKTFSHATQRKGIERLERLKPRLITKIPCDICGEQIEMARLSGHTEGHSIRGDIPKFSTELCFGIAKKERREKFNKFLDDLSISRRAEPPAVKPDKPSGIKRKCNFCAAVVSKNNLPNHAITRHFGEPLLKCSACGHTEKYQKRNILIHIRKSHPGIEAHPVDLRKQYTRELRELTRKCFDYGDF